MWFMIMWLLICILLGIYYYLTERDQNGLPTSSLPSCILDGIFHGWIGGCLIAFIYYILLRDPFNIG